jgi:hypothetical protein
LYTKPLAMLNPKFPDPIMAIFISIVFLNIKIHWL